MIPAPNVVGVGRLHDIDMGAEPRVSERVLLASSVVSMNGVAHGAPVEVRPANSRAIFNESDDARGQTSRANDLSSGH